MRCEQEMFDLILNTAKDDDRIRAVLLQGSRTNVKVKKDIFQDYDIVYVVHETQSFRNQKDWIDRFGERLYMQYPEDSVYFSSNVDQSYGWLMQFTDGNRLDLHVSTLPYVLNEIKNETLCQVLLDKEGCLPKLPPPTDKMYWIKKPTALQVYDTCNEFWWCLNNVAKGLWREDIPYVMDMLNDCVRPMLIRILQWHIGFQTAFSVSVGKSSKDMHRYLEAEVWEAFLKTYPAGNIDAIWKSVFLMCELFNQVAIKVCDEMQIIYHEAEAKNSLKFLNDVSRLPKEATLIY